MSKPKAAISGQFEPPHGDLKSYSVAFVSCLAISLLAYTAAVSDAVNDRLAIALIGGLAIIQCVIQLQRFLHLGTEFKPRWKLVVFSIMLTVVLIVVIGSLWIMSSLNYRMLHSPEQMNEYVESQDGL